MSIYIQATDERSQDLLVQASKANPAFGRILDDALPAALLRFAEKSLDYGDSSEELGPKAQFVDINRKIGKLRRALWLGIPLVDEQPIEVLEDLVAHCLLTIDMLQRDAQGVVVTEAVGIEGAEEMLVPGPSTTDDLCDNPSCLIKYPHEKGDHK